MSNFDNDEWLKTLNNVVSMLSLGLVLAILILVVASLSACQTAATEPKGPPPVKNECPAPEVQTFDKGEWTERDEASFTQAKKTCYRVYGPVNPCLVVFTRWEQGRYSAVCGPKGKT